MEEPEKILGIATCVIRSREIEDKIIQKKEQQQNQDEDRYQECYYCK